MAFELRWITSDADFEELMPALWSAFEKTTYLRIVFYIDPDPLKKEECLQTAIASTRAIWQSDSRTHWLKVVDSSTGKLMAASNWGFYKNNPYTEPEKRAIAVWWPEGEGRNYATQYWQQATAHKSRLFNRPHVYLKICFTVKEWAHRGAAKWMVECGVNKADELALDSFVEATEESKCLYEKYGFIWFDTIHIHPTTKEPSEAWRKLEQELPPEPHHLMWRPVTGKLTGTGENKYVLPWKESPTAKERKPLPQWAILRYAQLNNENVPDHKLKRRASLQCAQLNNESVPDHKLKRSASLLLQDALIRYAKLNNRSDSEEYEEI